jgi:two-component system OmpR family sensor kinase
MIGSMHLPLRWRLTLAFAVGMVVVLTTVGAFVLVRLRADLTESIDEGLTAQAELVASAVDRGVPLEGRGALVDPDDALAQVLDESGQVVAASSELSSTPFLTRSQLEAVAGPTSSEANIPGLDVPVRLLAVPRTDDDGTTYVVVGRPVDDREDALARFLVLLIVVGPVVLVLTTGLGWLVARAALRPVDHMRSEAAAMSVSEPERRLSVPPARDELRDLAETLNAMLERLQSSMQDERAFLDRASHELRTPLAVLKTELDLALARPRTPSELEAALHRSAEEVDMLVGLAEDLLVLSRLQGGRLPIRKGSVEIGPLLARVTAGFAPRAAAAGIRLAVDADGAGEVYADPVRVRQAVSNLVDNALRFSPRGGTIVVTARTIGGGTEIVVEDPGTGFASDTDAGLGLSIVKAVAEAHGGALEIGHGRDGGAKVTINLPG